MYLNERFKALTLENVLSRLDHARDLTKQFNLKWTSCRFAKYREVIARTVEYRFDPNAFDPLLPEAVNQVLQLIDSIPVWERIDDLQLEHLLEKSLDGKAEPPSDTSADHARNTLLELNAASILAEGGFDVTFGHEIGKEDFSFKIPGSPLPSFATECKRIASRKKVESNLAEIRDQVKERVARGHGYGFGIIGVERIIQMPFIVEDRVAADEAIDGGIQEFVNEFLNLRHRGKQRVRGDLVPALGVLYVGTCYVRSEAVLAPFQQLRLIPVDDTGRAVFDELTRQMTPIDELRLR